MTMMVFVFQQNTTSGAENVHMLDEETLRRSGTPKSLTALFFNHSVQLSNLVHTRLLGTNM
jgi:hypothetical protein